MSGMSKKESEQSMASCMAARESLQKSSFKDLNAEGINPESPAGRDFL